MGNNVEIENSTFLLFTLVGKYFVLDIDKVISIVELQEIINIPNSPPMMKGLISVRDEIIPVLDVQSKFSENNINISDENCFIIIDFYNGELEFEAAIRVDNVLEVVELNIKDFKPILSVNQSNGLDSPISSVITYKDELFLKIDFNKFFVNNQIIEIESFVRNISF